ncbi:hypothetical protein CesoFtcFv8_014153 [Champsocephalus esox]|uniref:Uncharacterized protein n=1 Tax=Champsocephalus esox TaxID=159716 RepID=A0AAN8BWD2_9TELE|nr:hypothetical protein CesoFtcFv8_014153 [Champsocephalus esox]
MAGLLARPPAICLRHSADSPRGPPRGYAPSHRCDSPANEYRGAQDIQTPTKRLGRLLRSFSGRTSAQMKRNMAARRRARRRMPLSMGSDCFDV